MMMRYPLALAALAAAAVLPSFADAAVSGTCTASAGPVNFSQPYNVIRGTPPLSATVTVTYGWSLDTGNNPTVTVNLLPAPASRHVTNGANTLNYAVTLNGTTFYDGSAGTVHFTSSESGRTGSGKTFTMVVTVPAGQDPKVSSTLYTAATLTLSCAVS